MLKDQVTIFLKQQLARLVNDIMGFLHLINQITFIFDTCHFHSSSKRRRFTKEEIQRLLNDTLH